MPPGDPAALADALLRLFADPPYARRLGVNGRSRVEEHLTWDAVVERMTPVLQRVTAAGPPRVGRRPPRFRRRERQAAER